MTNSTGTARLPIHMLANAVRRWFLTALFAAAGFSLVACGGGGVAEAAVVKRPARCRLP